MPAIFMFVGIIALIVVIGIVTVIADRKRTEALQNVANELGLKFLPDGDSGLFSALSGFQLFNLGRLRVMSKLILGETDDVTIGIFDYKYTIRRGKKRRSRIATVASLQSKQLPPIQFTMRPEGFFDGIGGMMGFQDIDFASHPNFSKMYVLKGENEQAIRSRFKPTVLEYFESKPGLSVESGNGAIIIFRPRQRVGPDEIKTLLAEAYEVFGIMVD